MATPSLKKKLSNFPLAERILYCTEETSACFVIAFKEKSLVVRMNIEFIKVYESLRAFYKHFHHYYFILICRNLI